MPLHLRKLLFLALLPLVAGCQRLEMEMDIANARMDEFQAKREGRQYIRPGLEPLYAPKPPKPEDMLSPAPVAPDGDYVPFPPGRLTPEQAEILLAGDPMALRFLAVKALAQHGLLPVEDAGQRKDTNLGALLPLTVPQPPAAGLEAPLPPLAEVIDRFAGLSTPRRGDQTPRATERDFLADTLLPKAPGRRQQYAPPDIASARKLQERLGRLEDAGLITPDQRAGESKAIEQLVSGGTLPEVLQPPPVAEPPKPARKPAATGGRGNRMPGGVSGRLEIIPSPPGVEPPRLTAAAKGPAGVHLLSMGSAGHGDKAWDALVKEHAELAALGHTVARADLGELGVTYRLIAGPMEPAQAESLCATLTPRGQSCTPTPFPTEAGK